MFASGGWTGTAWRFAGVTLTLCWLAVGCARAAPGDDSAKEGWGTLAGRVTLKGEIPVLAPLVRQGDEKVKDAGHCAEHDIPDERLVVDARSKGIRNVFVYLRRKPERVHHELLAALPKEVEFDQKGCRFLTHAVAMYQEQTLLIKNSDAVPHGTNVQGGPNGVNPFIPPDASHAHRFSRARPLPVPVTCNFHPWMRAWVLVQDHPYFAVTDDQGRFVIENLPAGVDLEFRLWHEATGYVNSTDGSVKKGSLRVTLEVDAMTTKNIEVDVSTFKLNEHH